METVNRILQEKITARIAPNKAVLIFGARRVGKTVMMRKIVDNYSGRTMMLNGEDYDTLALLENRSIANYRHLLDGIDLLAIDEAQNIPQIGSILKLIVDEIPGISVLASGSSSFDLLNKTGEPLVGRSTQFLLIPFSQREIAQTETALETRQNLEARLIYGSYPEVVMMENYGNYSGRFVVLPHAQLPSLQPTRVNRFFTKYEAVYNVSMLGLSCAINCNSRNGERSCFLAVSMTECITAYASAPRNVRKSPATFCFVFAGLTARSLALLSYGTSGLSRKVKI